MNDVFSAPVQIGAVKFASAWQYVAYMMHVDAGLDPTECLRTTSHKELRRLISQAIPCDVVHSTRVTDHLVVALTTRNLDDLDNLEAKGKFAKNIRDAVKSAKEAHYVT